MVNKMADFWQLNEAGTRLFNKNNPNQQVIIESIQPHKVGEKAFWSENIAVIISDIKLTRLSYITNELAERTGIEQQKPGAWRHYSPEKFFPRKLLKLQEPGFPQYNSAMGSFHSLWCKEHDILEIYANPWIWQITCKNISNENV